MRPAPGLLRNALAIVAGIVAGSVVNMAIITAGPALVPPPAGVDVTNAESLARAMPLFEPRHFAMPFLAHASGTLAGALVAYLVAATRRSLMAYLIGGVFLGGGVAAAFIIPAPAWFIALDLLVAYLPMAWLGIRLGACMKKASNGARIERA